MHKTLVLTLASALSTSMPALALDSESTKNETRPSALTENIVKATAPKENVTPFTPFTGKVTKSKVRMRLNPGLDSPILNELNQGDMVVVVGEDDDFFAIEPTEDIKAYVFRTYVLDGTVEGQHVNVRLEPILDAPVIAQLNTGDTVTGRISPINSKWLEITPPASTRFYISKDYIEKVGDSNYMAKVQKRRNEVNTLLEDAYTTSQSNLQRPYPEIDYDDIVGKYKKVISGYTDFDQQVGRAEDLLTHFKEAYTKKKIGYLETKSQEFANTEELQKENSQLSSALKKEKERLSRLQSKLNSEVQQTMDYASAQVVSEWQPVEDALYEEWNTNDEATMEDFYTQQAEEATTLRGILEPYSRNVRNKPGDYVLLNHRRVPIAFVYSTRVNLQDLTGREVTLIGAPRPNNNFAYPAYFVLTVQ